MAANRLMNETSPYLRQHAHNPVDWYPWGEEALQKAKKEDKPILVSIGYSACHWCHVMERESFEDPDTASIMNDLFVNIKIDREERPDLDHIYMDAVQAMTGSGGWPLNVFLTPDRKPFYGGTYFPPEKAFNRPSWKEVLTGVSAAFKERRHEIDAQAENLTEHLIQSNSFGLRNDGEETVFQKAAVDDTFFNIMKAADKVWGGFGKAPKFPHTFTIRFLLRYHHLTGNEEALQQAVLSIDKMIDGGIYDQIGGGFARYSTDSEWLVPHFEKMLYDNALLLTVISEAYQVTRNPRYKQVITETIQFLEREMLHPKGGFYTALDADSEGEEGKFYVWDYEEIQDLLGTDAGIFCRYFDITPSGNWEGKNIPWRSGKAGPDQQQDDLPAEELEKIIERGKGILLSKRNIRTRPGLDDKILLGWNALMISALCKAGAATGTPAFIELAERNLSFLFSNLRNISGEGFRHSWKEQNSKNQAFLDDYAFLIQALIDLQEITGRTDYLEKARQLTDYVLDNFSDEPAGLFFYTGKNQFDVVIRKKEVYDGALPSGNAVMFYNLYRLAGYFNDTSYRKAAIKATLSLGNAIIKYPVSFGFWAGLLQEITAGTIEIAVVGPASKDHLFRLQEKYIPYKIIMCTDTINNDYPLLADKKAEAQILFFVCKDYSCRKPVNTLEELGALIT